MENEKRTVDRKKLAEAMRTQTVKVGGAVVASEELWLQLADMIENSEEVVRCKECEHLCDCGEGKRAVCTMWGSWADPDEWCCRAEKRRDIE